MKRRLFFVASMLGFLLLLRIVRIPPVSQAFAPTPTPTPPGQLQPLDDQMPSPVEPVLTTSTPYQVTPILFVANDGAPHPLGLAVVDQQMQLIQHWYAEQLRGQTFDLAPAQLVIGTQSLRDYYGGCYPPTTTSAWGYCLWTNVFTDLAGLGYANQSDRILAVFLQTEGGGQVGLGSPGQFLFTVDGNAVFADCLAVGCADSVHTGSVAHELGHGFGLPHPDYTVDPDSYFNTSIMGVGVYFFPRRTFANTTFTPERDVLYASPFITPTFSLQDGGFEDCLSAWTIADGAPACTVTEVLSGLSALRLAAGSLTRLDQTMPVEAGAAYDIAGWLKIPAQTGAFHFQIELLALDATDDLLATFSVGDYQDDQPDWVRFGRSLTMPPDTTTARLQITAHDLSQPTYLDDLTVRRALILPPAPTPLEYSDKTAMPTLSPTLRWARVPAATAFRLQVAANRHFDAPLVDFTTASPFATLASLPAYDRRYFWRVKGSNGAGESDWSIPWSFIPRAPQDYYDDEFETGVLADGWTWLDEDPGNWGFGGPVGLRSHGYLYITTQAGDPTTNTPIKNLLLRDPPPYDYEISTMVDFWSSNQSNGQRSGLIIYQDDDNYIQLMMGYSTEFILEIQAEVDGQLVEQTAIPFVDPLPLKLERRGNTYRGYYSPDGLIWRVVGGPVSATWPAAQLGLTAYDPLDLKRITAFFNWFRLRPGCVDLAINADPPAGGTVLIDEGDCDGQTHYTAGLPLTLTATANPGYHFEAWSGVLTGTTNPMTLTLLHDARITATYTLAPAPPESFIYLPVVYK